MNFRQFAFNNVRRNLPAYMAYFLSSSFAVMTFFTYLMFIHHPDIAKSEMGTMAQAGMTVASYITFIFSFLFVLYSISAFLKARMKEFGVLTILGAERGQLNRLILIENMIIGTSSVITGMLSGLLFSKLFLLIGSNLLEIKELPMYFPIKALWMTVTAFISLFLIISLLTSIMVRQSKALEMLQGSNKPKKEPKASIWLAILSAISFAGAFYLMQKGISDAETMLCIILLDMIGTYFLFTQMSVFIIRLLKKNRLFYWRGVNLLWVSEMAYKVKDNARMFFMVTIVTAMACTTAGAVLAINKQSEHTYMEEPFAFSYLPFKLDVESNEKEKTGKVMEKLDTALVQAGVKYQKVTVREVGATFKNLNHWFSLVPQSDYHELQKSMALPSISLQPGEALLIQSKMTKNELPKDLTQLVFKNQKLSSLKVKEQFAKTLIGPRNLVIVNDATYTNIIETAAAKDREEISYNYLVSNWHNDKLPSQDSEEVKLSIEISNWNDSLLSNGEGDGIILSRAADYMLMKQGTSVMMFVGLFIVAIFSVFIASFLYFKLFTDLQQDQRYYKGLSKMGLSQTEMKRAATIQISLLFYIPLFFAGIQTLIGLTAIQNMLYIVNSTTIVAFSAIGIFIAVQTIYFFIVRSRYLAQLKRVMV